MDSTAIAEVFGWLGGSAGTVLLWPQVWLLWVRRQHSGLSLTANVIGVVYSCGWMYYGISQHSAAMTATNGAALVAMIAILAGQLRLARPALSKWLPTLLAGFAFLMVLALTAGPAAVGGAVGLGAVASIGTQVFHLVRLRRAGDEDVRGVSRLRWWLAAYCNSMWIVYGVLKVDWVLIFPATMGVVLSIAILLLTLPRKPIPVTA